MSASIRYVIIGCGEHALQSHAIPSRKVDGLELVALSDPSEESLRMFEKGLGFTLPHLSEEEVFADPSIDAVLIASPDRFHVKSLACAVEAGKHVLCEKPLVTKVQDLVMLTMALNRAENNGLVVTSCHPRRFDPPYVWLADEIREIAEDDKHSFGRPLSIHLDFSYHKPSKVGLHKGLLIDHISHEYDLVTFLFGRSRTWMQKLTDSQTHYQAVGQREDGIALFFEGTRRLETSVYPEFVCVRFERGEIRMSCKRAVATILHHETGEVESLFGIATNYPVRFFSVMDNFARAIRGVEQSYLTMLDLFENSEVGIALTETGLWDPHKIRGS